MVNKEQAENIRGKGIKFISLRRITGYIGDTKQFSSAKQQEEQDRVKHK